VCMPAASKACQQLVKHAFLSSSSVHAAASLLALLAVSCFTFKHLSSSSVHAAACLLALLALLALLLSKQHVVVCMLRHVYLLY